MDNHADSKVRTEAASRKLRFVLYRPHSNIWFRNTVGRVLKRKPLPNKYAPFLDYLLQAEIDVFFASCLVHEGKLLGLLRRLLDGFELVLWCVINGFSLRRVGFIFTKNDLLGKDVLLLMHYGNFTNETERVAEKGMALAQAIATVKIHKIVHLTHYAYCPAIGARNLTVFRPNMLIAENDLARNSDFYKKYFFNISGESLCLPYTPARRFCNRKIFSQRINKLVVTGSITYKMKSPEFIDFYGVDELQPMRRKLYEEAADYKGQMDCLISDLNATRKIESTSLRSRFHKIIARIFGSQAQMDYYKRDIVDIYNAYTMFAVPEEICDLPAIGFVEGMACGAAYLGLSNPMYQDIGMVAGVHYIAYDGTVADLMAKVHYYQQHRDEVERIAEEGRRFISTCLSTEAVYGKFIKRLQSTALTIEGIH
jgi:hypothetical protein